MSKCLIVTGGGRGIGAEVSRKAAKQGYSVCVNFHRDQTSAQKLVRELEEEGANALAYQADVSQEEEVEALFQTVEKHLGTPEALVNNAGILDLQTRVDGMDAERIQRIFAVNVTGSFLCAREAVKRMSTKYGGTGGSIVNLSSGAAKYGSPGEYVDYAASKAAIDTLTIGLAGGMVEPCEHFQGAGLAPDLEVPSVAPDRGQLDPTTWRLAFRLAALRAALVELDRAAEPEVQGP